MIIRLERAFRLIIMKSLKEAQNYSLNLSQEYRNLLCIAWS